MLVSDRSVPVACWSVYPHAEHVGQCQTCGVFAWEEGGGRGSSVPAAIPAIYEPPGPVVPASPTTAAQRRGKNQCLPPPRHLAVMPPRRAGQFNFKDEWVFRHVVLGRTAPIFPILIMRMQNGGVAHES